MDAAPQRIRRQVPLLHLRGGQVDHVLNPVGFIGRDTL
jgi:hypothetical protein